MKTIFRNLGNCVGLVIQGQVQEASRLQAGTVQLETSAQGPLIQPVHKYTLDELRQSRGLSFDIVECPPPLVLTLGATESERIEVEPNLRERGAQLVRHARHECPAHGRELG